MFQWAHAKTEWIKVAEIPPGWGGGEGTPFFCLYDYVLLDRVWFLRPLCPKQGIN